MLQPKSRYTALVTVFASLFLANCTKQSDHAENTGTDRELFAGTLNPVPGDRDSIDSQIQRYLGQTKFLSVGGQGGPVLARAAAAENAPGGDGARREIQESDVVKVGEKGSKELFLLNGLRGLQVVSFKNGPEKPSIVGSVAGTNNYPEDMYIDKKHKKIYVLERNWYDPSQPSYQQVTKSRIITYDTSDAAKPKEVGKLELVGEVAGSRLVGNVLYVATADRRYSRNNESESAGYAYSILLDGGVPKAVTDAYRLNLPVGYRKDVNIVEELTKDGKYRYYLIATLGAGWGDRQNSVEVVDINDPAGTIRPIFVATAKGNAEEKSSTYIRDNSLVVVSEFRPNFPDAKTQYAVETFKFPTEADIAGSISWEDADLRIRYIDNTLSKIADWDAKEEKLAQLMDNPEWTLKGVLVEPKAEQRWFNTDLENAAAKKPRALKKLSADFVTTIRDSRGQHADLQDVRVLDNRLFAFWVPRDRIDPLDVFDISDVSNKGTPRVAHLEDFPGWITRSEVLKYKDRTFVVGLGYVIPDVNNERGRQFPQSILFEIKGQGAETKAETIAMISLKDRNAWINDSEDKLIDFRVNSETGQGSVLFTISSYEMGTGYGQAGKMIGFNLEAAVAGKKDEVFSEGALMPGDSGWLRRVFSNPEIEKINTFSDVALGTYEPSFRSDAKKTAEAISILELARNIQRFISLGDNKGVQIIGESNDYFQPKPKKGVELRLVALDRADSEADKVEHSLVLEGGIYESSLALDATSLLVLTSESKETKKATEKTAAEFKAVYRITRVALKEGKLVSTDVESFEMDNAFGGRGRGFGRGWGFWIPEPLAADLWKTPSGSLLFSRGSELKQVVVDGETVSATKIETVGCEMKDQHVQIENLDGQLVATFATHVEDKKRKNVSYTRNFLSVAKLEGGKLTCGKFTNIPGTALVVKGKVVITDDQQFESFTEHRHTNGKEEHVWYDVKASRVLSAVELDEPARRTTGVAKLSDLYELDLNQWGASKPKTLANGQVAYLVQNNENPWDSGEQGAELAVVAVDAESKRFVERRLGIPSALRWGSLVEVLATADGTALGLISDGSKGHLVSWGADLNAKVRTVSVVSRSFEEGDSVTEFPVSVRGSYWFDRSQTQVLDLSGNRVTIAQGFYGIQQLILK